MCLGFHFLAPRIADQRDPRFDKVDVLVCNAGITWDGVSDWSLPNLMELASIADTRQQQPTIDPARNRAPIADILAEELPENGTVLELASGTGEHAVYFASRFPNLQFQPSDFGDYLLETVLPICR